MFVPFRLQRNTRNKTEQTSAFLKAGLTTFVTFRHFPCIFGKTWPPKTSILVRFRVRTAEVVNAKKATATQSSQREESHKFTNRKPFNLKSEI